MVVVLCGLAVAAGCSKKAAPSASVPPAAGTEIPADGPTDLPRGVTVCEVEMSGRIQQTVSGNRAPIVYTAIDDCMPATARILDRTEALGDGSFFVEVFVPCGTRLSLCGAIEKKVNPDHKPLPTARYGKLDRTLLAVGVGEIEFANLGIPLTDGPEKTFPAPKLLMDRPADRPMRPGHPLAGQR